MVVGIYGAHGGGWRVADDEDFSDSEPFRVEAVHRRYEVTVIVVGDLGASTSRRLRDFVEELLAMRPRSIAIDARGVTFVDSSGMGALLSVRHAIATEAGLAFRIIDPSPALRRTAELAGFTELLRED
jgi:anti-anti-sigma factor